MFGPRVFPSSVSFFPPSPLLTCLLLAGNPLSTPFCLPLALRWLVCYPPMSLTRSQCSSCLFGCSFYGFSLATCCIFLFYLFFFPIWIIRFLLIVLDFHHFRTRFHFTWSVRCVHIGVLIPLTLTESINNSLCHGWPSSTYIRTHTHIHTHR